MTEEISAIAKAIEARPRKLYDFDIGKHIGLGPEVHKVKIWTITKREQDLAWERGHAYVAKLGERTPGVLGNRELLEDTLAAFVVFAACRDFTRPEKMPTWPSGEWIHEHLTADQIAALLRLVNIVRAQDGPFPDDIHDERVEAFIKLAADNVSNDAPDATLAMVPHSYLTQLFILSAVKLQNTRNELESLKVVDPEPVE